MRRTKWLRRRRRSLAGSVVCVTGGSRGLGLLIAREAARKGARLVICARNAAELEIAERQLRAAGAEVLARVCDVGDVSAVQDLVQEAFSRFGRIDVLVNNASIIQVSPSADLTLADYEEALDANLRGAVHATLAVLPSMRARRDGAVVNVTSIGGTIAVPHLLPYTTAKFGLVGFSLGLAGEEAMHGIRVHTIVPGLMRTGSFVHARVKGDMDGEATAFSLSSALPLITMDARRAARAIVRAVERDARFVVLGVPFKIARIAYALAPGVATRVMGVVNRRLLPRPSGLPSRPHEPIWKHRSGVARRGSPLMTLGERAAEENNETQSVGDNP